MSITGHDNRESSVQTDILTGIMRHTKNMENTTGRSRQSTVLLVILG